MAEYDSLPETNEHINRVRHYLDVARDNLYLRGQEHDRSKLIGPEKAIFDEVTPRLKGLTYGSDEYKASLAEMKPALDHHYAHNAHHPEHYALCANGEANPDELEQGAAVARMSLLDIIEMLVDWKAASERHADGDIRRSIDVNEQRFGLTPQLACILRNTADEMGW